MMKQTTKMPTTNVLIEKAVVMLNVVSTVLPYDAMNIVMYCKDFDWDGKDISSLYPRQRNLFVKSFVDRNNTQRYEY